MMQDLLVAVVGIIGLIAVWVFVQGLARRHLIDACDGPDVLACKSCDPDRACSCSMFHSDISREQS